MSFEKFGAPYGGVDSVASKETSLEKNKEINFIEDLEELTRSVDDLGEINKENYKEKFEALRNVIDEYKKIRSNNIDLTMSNRNFDEQLFEQRKAITKIKREYLEFRDKNLQKKESTENSKDFEVVQGKDKEEIKEDNENKKEQQGEMLNGIELANSLEEIENNVEAIGEIDKDNYNEKKNEFKNVVRQYKEIINRFGDALKVDQIAKNVVLDLKRKLEEKNKEISDVIKEVKNFEIIGNLENLEKDVYEIGEINKDNYTQKGESLKKIIKQYKEIAGNFGDEIKSDDTYFTVFSDLKNKVESLLKDYSNLKEQGKNFEIIGNLENLEKDVYEIGEINKDNYTQKSESLKKIIKQYKEIAGNFGDEIKSDDTYFTVFSDLKNKVESLSKDYLDSQEQRDEIQEKIAYKFSIDDISLEDELSQDEIEKLKKEREVLKEIIDSKIVSLGQELDVANEDEKEKIKLEHVKFVDSLKNKVQKIDEILNDKKEEKIDESKEKEFDENDRISFVNKNEEVELSEIKKIEKDKIEHNKTLQTNESKKVVKDDKKNTENKKEIKEEEISKIMTISKKEFEDSLSKEERDTLRESEMFLSNKRTRFVEKKIQLEKISSRLGSLFDTDTSNQLAIEFEEIKASYKEAQEIYINNLIVLNEKDGKIDSDIARAISRRVKIGEFSNVVKEEDKIKFHERKSGFKFLNGKLAVALSLKIEGITKKLFKKKMESKKMGVNSEMLTIGQQIKENSHDGKIDSKNIKDILLGRFEENDEAQQENFTSENVEVDKENKEYVVKEERNDAEIKQEEMNEIIRQTKEEREKENKKEVDDEIRSGDLQNENDDIVFDTEIVEKKAASEEENRDNTFVKDDKEMIDEEVRENDFNQSQDSVRIDNEETPNETIKDILDNSSISKYAATAINEQPYSNKKRQIQYSSKIKPNYNKLFSNKFKERKKERDRIENLKGNFIKEDLPTSKELVRDKEIKLEQKLEEKPKTEQKEFNENKNNLDFLIVEGYKQDFENILNSEILGDVEKLSDTQVIDIEEGRVDLPKDKIKKFQELKLLIGGVLHEESNSKNETLEEYVDRVVEKMVEKCIVNKACNEVEFKKFNEIFLP